MKNNYFKIKFLTVGLALTTSGFVFAQIRVVNSDTFTSAENSSAFIDASSDVALNNTSNIGKGLLFPRTDLSTFTFFGGSPIGIGNSYPTRYDGMIVYNIKDDGNAKAAVGNTQGELKRGFWYYENKSTSTNGGTWKQLSNPTTNILSLSGNTLTSNVNGVLAQVTLPAASSGIDNGANNGLSKDGTTIQLGGNLNKDTRIDNFGNSFIIVGAGNTGIGTESPTNKLHVANGKLRLEDGTQGAGKILTSDAAGVASWSNLPESGVDNPANNGLSKDGTTIQLGGALTKATTISGNYDFNISGIGQVGFGTNNPIAGSKVNIQGGPLNIGALFSYTGGLQVVNQNSSRPIARFYSSDNTERVTFGEGGNVGIGTDEPTQKLDIDGSIRVRGTKLMPINDDDRILAIEPNGYVKKVNIARVVNLGNFGGSVNVAENAGTTQLETLNITVPAGMKYRVLLNMKLQLSPTIIGNFIKIVNGNFILADNTTNLHNEQMGAGTYFIPGSENNGDKLYIHNMKDTTVSYVYEINNTNGNSAITKTLYFRYNTNNTISPQADKRHNFVLKGTFTTFEMP